MNCWENIQYVSRHFQRASERKWARNLQIQLASERKTKLEGLLSSENWEPIGEYTCREYKQKGHWKNQCPFLAKKQKDDHVKSVQWCCSQGDILAPNNFNPSSNLMPPNLKKTGVQPHQLYSPSRESCVQFGSSLYSQFLCQCLAWTRCSLTLCWIVNT